MTPPVKVWVPVNVGGVSGEMMNSEAATGESVYPAAIVIDLIILQAILKNSEMKTQVYITGKCLGLIAVDQGNF